MGEIAQLPLERGFHCPFDSPETLTFPGQANRPISPLSRAGIWSGHFGLNSSGPLRNDPAKCFIVWASGESELCWGLWWWGWAIRVRVFCADIVLEERVLS